MLIALVNQAYCLSLAKFKTVSVMLFTDSFLCFWFLFFFSACFYLYFCMTVNFCVSSFRLVCMI